MKKNTDGSRNVEYFHRGEGLKEFITRFKGYKIYIYNEDGVLIRENRIINIFKKLFGK